MFSQVNQRGPVSLFYFGSDARPASWSHGGFQIQSTGGGFDPSFVTKRSRFPLLADDLPSRKVHPPQVLCFTFAA